MRKKNRKKLCGFSAVNSLKTSKIKPIMTDGTKILKAKPNNPSDLPKMSSCQLMPCVSKILSVPCSLSRATKSNPQKKMSRGSKSCKIIRPNKSKRTRFLAFSAIAEAGYVNVVRADWNEEFFNPAVDTI